MNRRLFSAGLLGLFGGSACAETAAPPATGLIGEVLARTGAPALAGAVVAREGVVWLQAGGVRREGSPEPVTTDDLWHLGSNTKAMTAAVYARLVESGRAHWGATVPELFPGLAVDPAWRATTVEALLSHRAGLSDAGLIDGTWLRARHGDQRPLTEQRAEFAARALGAPPGGTAGAFEYGNANYIVVGAAIERITAAAWEQAMRTELFAPLGMTTAGFGAPKGDQPWGHADGLFGTGLGGGARDPAGIADNPAALGPAGTAHMALKDHAAFVRLFLNQGGGLLKPETVARLTRPTLAAEEPGYALGWGVYNHRDWALGPALFHEGSNSMWHALAVVGPARGLAVVTASNDSRRGAAAVRDLAARLIERFAKG